MGLFNLLTGAALAPFAVAHFGVGVGVGLQPLPRLQRYVVVLLFALMRSLGCGLAYQRKGDARALTALLPASVLSTALGLLLAAEWWPRFGSWMHFAQRPLRPDAEPGPTSASEPPPRKKQRRAKGRSNGNQVSAAHMQARLARGEACRG